MKKIIASSIVTALITWAVTYSMMYQPKQISARDYQIEMDSIDLILYDGEREIGKIEDCYDDITGKMILLDLIIKQNKK